MALPAESGVIMHVSPCQPRSAIFATATAMPALIFSASKPGGSEGSEKSTVSGFWPTNSIRVMSFLHGMMVAGWLQHVNQHARFRRRKLAGDVECLACGKQHVWQGMKRT